MAKGLVDMLLKDPTISAASKVVTVIQLAAAELISGETVEELLFGSPESGPGIIKAENVKCCSKAL